MKKLIIQFQTAMLTAMFFFVAGAAVQAASSGLTFTAPKLPPGNAGVAYGPNGQGISFCLPAPTQVSDL
ncbi:MAG TPA: hypothetical protein VGA73_05320, partial [Candidatus Binatia bacterium]